MKKKHSKKYKKYIKKITKIKKIKKKYSGGHSVPTHPHSHVLMLKTWEVGSFFEDKPKRGKKKQKEKGERVGRRGGKKKRKSQK